MKHKFFGLTFVSLILTSCQASAPAQVDFPLDSSKILLTSEQLTQDEYYEMAGHLFYDEDVMGLDFSVSIKSVGGQVVDITTTGSWNQNFSNDNEEFETLVLKTGNSTWVASRYLITDPHISGYNVEYLTFGGKLECGLLKKLYDREEVNYYYNPNLPINYYETEHSAFQTNPSQYHAMERAKSIFVNRCVPFYKPHPSRYGYSKEDVQLFDKPVYSHELTSTQLILREERKINYFVMANPDDDLYDYYDSLIGEGSPFYVKSTYYYNYRNGTLSKYECSFYLPECDAVEHETVGTCVVEYKNRQGKEKSEVEGYVNKFLAFKGVKEGINLERL